MSSPDLPDWIKSLSPAALRLPAAIPLCSHATFPDSALLSHSLASSPRPVTTKTPPVSPDLAPNEAPRPSEAGETRHGDCLDRPLDDCSELYDSDFLRSLPDLPAPPGERSWRGGSAARELGCGAPGDPESGPADGSAADAALAGGPDVRRIVRVRRHVSQLALRRSRVSIAGCDAIERRIVDVWLGEGDESDGIDG